MTSACPWKWKILRCRKNVLDCSSHPDYVVKTMSRGGAAR